MDVRLHSGWPDIRPFLEFGSSSSWGQNGIRNQIS